MHRTETVASKFSGHHHQHWDSQSVSQSAALTLDRYYKHIHQTIILSHERPSYNTNPFVARCFDIAGTRPAPRQHNSHATALPAVASYRHHAEGTHKSSNRRYTPPGERQQNVAVLASINCVNLSRRQHLRNALFDALHQLSGTHYRKLFSVVTLLQFFKVFKLKTFHFSQAFSSFSAH